MYGNVDRRRGISVNPGSLRFFFGPWETWFSVCHVFAFANATLRACVELSKNSDRAIGGLGIGETPSLSTAGRSEHWRSNGARRKSNPPESVRCGRRKALRAQWHCWMTAAPIEQVSLGAGVARALFGRVSPASRAPGPRRSAPRSQQNARLHSLCDVKGASPMPGPLCNFVLVAPTPLENHLRQSQAYAPSHCASDNHSRL